MAEYKLTLNTVWKSRTVYNLFFLSFHIFILNISSPSSKGLLFPTKDCFFQRNLFIVSVMDEQCFFILSCSVHLLNLTNPLWHITCLRIEEYFFEEIFSNFFLMHPPLPRIILDRMNFKSTKRKSYLTHKKNILHNIIFKMRNENAGIFLIFISWTVIQTK